MFSRLYVNMVRAGEASGSLQETLRRLAEYLERSRAMREGVVSALIYPAILLVLASPLVALFSYAVGPWDAQPWWEGMSGTLAVAAGLSLLVAAVRQHPAGEATQVESTVPSYA